ncbi:MAG: OmpA family protein [Saprospirales bacterium]|nr:OmpA family protein [Saprospirales bacterium]
MSTERARACYDYLVYRGVAAARLRSAGHGEAKPIASNKSEKGREQNRRVEFNMTLEFE